MTIKMVGGYSLKEIDEMLKGKKQVVEIRHENGKTVLELA